MKDTFLIVDGNSLMYRAFHALPLMDAGGTYTNSIYGFLSMLLKVIREENVQYLAVCFDEHAPTFRHTVYADYKAGRKETPDELRQQFVTVKPLLDEMGIRYYSLSGWEADDLLGTLSLKAGEQGVLPLLLTGDRDALQLVDGTTELMFTRKGITETVRFTPGKVYEEYGFTPAQVTDWKGMAGDSSDNIPGIPGIGDKTAVKLLQQYGTLENIIAHAGEVKGKLGEKLAAGQEQARFCKELATIRRDAPVAFALADCVLPDMRKGIPALKKLHLNSIVRRLEPEENAQQGNGPAETPADPTENGLLTEPMELIDFPAVTLYTEDELAAWLEKQTSGEQVLCVYMDDTVISMAVPGAEKAVMSLGGDLLNPGMDPVSVLQTLVPYMKRGNTVVHDSKKMLKTLTRFRLDLPESFEWDTLLGAYLIEPQEKSYRLGALLPTLPEDAGALCDLYLWQKKVIEKAGMMSLMRDVEMKLAFVLFRMEETGFAVDVPFLKELGMKYTEEIAALKQQVIDACGAGPFNLNSPVQLGEVLFEKLRLPHGKKTARGYSTAVEVLEGLRDIAPEVIDPLLRYRQLTKLNGTYVEGMLPLVDREGRLHTCFDQAATATGRLSSSEPNLQNIPVRTEEGKEIRRAFLPREGWVLLDADYSQIELRLMAHFSGDEAMLDAFRKGQDIHARTAGEIFEVPQDEVTPELRSRAKAVNFGLIYGISGFGLSKNTGVSVREAGDFIARYFDKYPGVKDFMDRSAEDGARKGYAVTMLGRRRYLPELASPKAQIREFGKRAAMNTPVQGTAADIIKLAMVRVDEALKKEDLQARLVLQVHDELILECPPEEAERGAELLKRCMEEVIELKVPLVAEVHTGKNWAEAK